MRPVFGVYYNDIIFRFEKLQGYLSETKVQGNGGEEITSPFYVKNGQVFYYKGDNIAERKDLEFPAGQIQDFFKKLTENIGTTITYGELEKITTREKIRGYKHQVSKILKDNSVPYKIITLANEGYVLHQISE